MKDLLTQFYEYCEKYIPRKWRLTVLVLAAFFIIVGIVFSSRFVLDRLMTAFSFVQTKVVPAKEEPVIHYATQDLLIDTPYDAALVIKEPIFPDHVCSIADFGAVPDGRTLNTEAFRQAIASCVAAGGGKVLVPPGTWLTGPIRLESNINLSIERDATILFSTNFNDYLPTVLSRFEGIEYYSFAPPISAAESTNVAVTGVGTIDGQGALAWWKLKDRATPNINTLYAMGDDNVPVAERLSGSETTGLRPAFVEFTRCHNVLIENIKVRNGPMWTLHPLYSDNVVIRGVDIHTNPGPSTDGVAVDSSSRVLIENSTFNTGDDAIVLKSGRDQEGLRLHHPTENIVIRNNTIRDTHAAIAIGSEMSGDVRNIFATDIAIDTAQFAFRIKASRGRGGVVENIWAQNFTAKHTTIEAIQISTAYGLPFRIDSVALPTFRHIHLKNFFTKLTSQAINVDGLPELPISDVSFEDITFKKTRLGVEMRDVDDVSFKNITAPSKDDEPVFTITDSTRVTIDHATCPATTPRCLILGGARSDAIHVQNSDFDAKRIKQASEVRSGALTY